MEWGTNIEGGVVFKWVYPQEPTVFGNVPVMLNEAKISRPELRGRGRGQGSEVEAEAEARTMRSRPRPRPISGGRGQGRGQR